MVSYPPVAEKPRKGGIVLRTYTGTRLACYTGYFVQAIINNLSPLFFVLFQQDLGLTYAQISWLVLANFLTQLAVDLLAVRLVDRLGVRLCVVAAHIFSVVGLIALGALPLLLSDPFAALLAATMTYAAGSGLIEVLISPIVDSLPSDRKAASMSLLHSFYCWGQVAVVSISTLLLCVVGTARWCWLAWLWAVVPLINLLNFLTVPLVPLAPEGHSVPVRSLLRTPWFLVALLLMLCAGASELTMSQWASLFVEQSLGVPKVMGDLLGPCMFAVAMGTGRLLFGLCGDRLPLKKSLTWCAGGCAAAYVLTALVPHPAAALVGCGLCGLSVSLMWPGVFSLSAAALPRAGTALFALLAMCGDLGCASGPWLSGMVSSLAASGPLQPLQAGMLAGLAFPLLMLLLLACLRRFPETEHSHRP